MATLSPKKIEAEPSAAVSALHPLHARRFAEIAVPLRLVPVVAHPGEHVWVVAEHHGRILYYSDVEQGWGPREPGLSRWDH